MHRAVNGAEHTRPYEERQRQRTEAGVLVRNANAIDRHNQLSLHQSSPASPGPAQRYSPALNETLWNETLRPADALYHTVGAASRLARAYPCAGYAGV